MAAYRAVREAASSSDCARCPRRLSFRRLRKWRYQWKKPESGGDVCGGLEAATDELGGGAQVGRASVCVGGGKGGGKPTGGLVQFARERIKHKHHFLLFFAFGRYSRTDDGGHLKIPNDVARCERVLQRFRTLAERARTHLPGYPSCRELFVL